MARSIEIALAPNRTEALAAEIQAMEGVVGLSLQRGASLAPPGDVLTVHATNQGMAGLWCLLDRHGIGREGGTVVTSEPRSILAASGRRALEGESNEMAWQEMAYQMRQEANPNGNFLLSMLFAGAVAAAGLWTDTLHIVIGAMVIAPGFEPIIRIPFGLLGRASEGTRRGLHATLAGYLALAFGAALALLLLQVIDPQPTPLGERHWVRYWSSVQASSVLIALVAGAAGAVIVASGRSVLTAGVMIALALIPAMAIAGMAAVAGDPGLALRGLIRWATDAACLLVAGGGAFLAKRVLRHPEAG